MISLHDSCKYQVGEKQKVLPHKKSLPKRRMGKMNLSWQLAVMPHGKWEKVSGDKGTA